MKVVRDTSDPTRGKVVGERGDVLGFARNVQEMPDGSMTWENDWPATSTPLELSAADVQLALAHSDAMLHGDGFLMADARRVVHEGYRRVRVNFVASEEIPYVSVEGPSESAVDPHWRSWLEYGVAVRARIRNVDRPLHAVQLGWAFTVWALWRLVRERFA